VYVGSVRLLYDGGSLYDCAAESTGAPFTYPPFAGLVFFPLPLLDEAAAVLALLLFLSAPVSSNLRFGQVSVFLTLLVLLDCLRLVPTRFAGIATGIAAPPATGAGLIRRPTSVRVRSTQTGSGPSGGLRYRSPPAVWRRANRVWQKGRQMPAERKGGRHARARAS
jgi:hypothetical protein